MRVARFMDYHAADGVNRIEKWYEAQEPAIQVAFDFTLREILALNDLTGYKRVRRSRGCPTSNRVR